MNTKSTDLIWLIEQDADEINAYLGDVPYDQFIIDLRTAFIKKADKGAIKDAIDSLQKILDAK